MQKIYNVNIKGITDDSRKVKKGFLFVAIRGLHHDGHDYISEVVEKGAKLIVGELDPSELNLPEGVVYKQVKNSKKTLGEIASKWFGNPSKKLTIIGVTGTDGKTTTSSLIYWILKKAGYKVSLVSTVSAHIGSKEYDTGFHVTNPEPIALHEFLAKMVKEGSKYAVLEVTSHGIDQERISGIDFDIGVITNITHEHLDYHGTFEKYRDTKVKFLSSAKKVVLNKDDTSFAYLNEKLKDKEVFVYSWEGKFQGLVPGDYNDSNVSAAATVAKILGVKELQILSALKTFELPPGRLEKINNVKELQIYVDFAHTPNALARVLGHLSREKKGKLIVVFGSAGERDALKRPMMGEVAGRFADLSIITAEDPRSEEVNDISYQIAEGVKKSKGDLMAIPERGEAISYAIQKVAEKGDTVVICGKGHEKSMSYKGIEYPWSDQEAVGVALKGGVKKVER